ncbi:hypothetical protein HMPREF9554_02374 [Treponema phagedenis F0421]|nr:hypothetical protein HMPREF9554_02374 [Treponema phagedenis F0421]
MGKLTIGIPNPHAAIVNALISITVFVVPSVVVKPIFRELQTTTPKKR